ncbi:beta-1,6-galactanase, partial [Streptomyces sp. NPDC056730]
MMRRRTLLAATGAGLLGSALATGTAHADVTIPVDPSADYGVWEGWGTSLAWWAKLFGDRDDLADLFFTTKWVTYDGASRPGLGLN